MALYEIICSLLTAIYGGCIMHAYIFLIFQIYPGLGNKMERTTIMLPHDLKAKASNFARKMGMSLGQLIRETLEKNLDDRSNVHMAGDPFLDDNVTFDGDSPGNAASEHDRYLYGDLR